MDATPASTGCTFDHVAQQVPDIAAAVEWYRRTIPGCQVLYQDETWAFLDAAGAKLAFVRESDHPAHLAWRVSADDLARLAETHRQTVRTHRDRTRSFYLQTPAGQWIEFITYPVESAAQ